MFDQLIAKFDPNGNCLGLEYFGPFLVDYRIISDNSNNIITTGKISEPLFIGHHTLNPNGNRNFYLAKHDSTITHIEEPIKSSEFEELVIMPNPMDGTCTILLPESVNPAQEATLLVYNSQGQVLKRIAISKGQEQAKIELDLVAKGLYPVKLVQGNRNYTGRIMFQK